MDQLEKKQKTILDHVYEKSAFILAGLFVVGAAWIIFQLLGLKIIVLVLISFVILIVAKGGFVLLLK